MASPESLADSVSTIYHYDWLLPFLQLPFFLLLLLNLLYLFLFAASVCYFGSLHYHSLFNCLITIFLHSLACPIPYFEFLNFHAAILNSKKRMWRTPYKDTHNIIIHIFCRYFRSINWLINTLLKEAWELTWNKIQSVTNIQVFKYVLQIFKYYKPFKVF